MRDYEQLAAQIDAFVDSQTPEQLARRLMSHGVRFRNPPPPTKDDPWPALTQRVNQAQLDGEWGIVREGRLLLEDMKRAAREGKT